MVNCWYSFLGNLVIVLFSRFGLAMIIVLIIGWLFFSVLKFILVIDNLLIFVFSLVYLLICGVIRLCIWLKVCVFILNWFVSFVICFVDFLLMIWWWMILLVLMFCIIELL